MLLVGCHVEKASMLQLLESLEQQNRSGEEMLNDSIAEMLVDYFDRHGNDNERMRSKYILGRTYFCLGELPRALDIYNKAIDCVDTTSIDCDFAKLSRVYAQKATIFYEQLQARSQLESLRDAERFARKGKDTIMAIECFAQQANAYSLLKLIDSVILVKQAAANLFLTINQRRLAVQTLSTTILPLLEKKDVSQASKCLKDYELFSGNFDENGDICKGREIYYYVKGKYYLAIGNVDSAELLFRKELSKGTNLNHLIAGYKGLQEVFEQHKNADSIAKYANLGYQLNDSAYSLSEMQSIQKFQASYNYNHIKYLAEKSKLESTVAWLIVALISFLVIMTGLYFGKKYRLFRKAALDYRLRSAAITRHLKELANSNPPQYPTLDDWDLLRQLVEKEIPLFRQTLKVNELSLTEFDYDVCLMIRVQLLPIEISRLKKCSPSHISNIRKRLLLRIFNKEGGSEVFDDEIGKIVR